jgi:hypothetical protein
MTYVSVTFTKPLSSRTDLGRKEVAGFAEDMVLMTTSAGRDVPSQVSHATGCRHSCRPQCVSPGSH